MTHTTPQILLHDLNYFAANDQCVFKDLTLFLGNVKTGVVGRNGIGKSTLLKLIAGELIPASGSIQVTGTLGYCPQLLLPDISLTVGELLGIKAKLDALARIESGVIHDADFEILGEDWMIRERITRDFSAFGLDGLRLDQHICELSGGETTRLMLIRAFSHDPDYLILDEPTNNLDLYARRRLYEKIVQWEKGLLVVSHDRTLLNFMTETIELNTFGASRYGGNFDHYQEQKSLLGSALDHELADAKKALKKTAAVQQLTRERSEQKRARGRRLFMDGKIDKLFANSMRGRSERTQGRMAMQKENRMRNAIEKLEQAKSSMELPQEIHLQIDTSGLPNSKVVLDIEDLCFAYKNEQPLIHRFNLRLTGPERIALVGSNGCGKSTLVKLILRELNPCSGKIYLGTDMISYLDQHTALLDPECSILDNYMNINPDASTQHAHAALATFLFRNTAAQRLVKDLSGGEKLKAELACTLLSSRPPQLLILDEPTNHLDLDSLISVEGALNDFQGAIIAISHDENFLHNIHITRSIHAPFAKT